MQLQRQEGQSAIRQRQYTETVANGVKDRAAGELQVAVVAAGQGGQLLELGAGSGDSGVSGGHQLDQAGWRLSGMIELLVV